MEQKWFRQHWVVFGGVSMRTKRVLPTFFLLKFVVCSGVSIGTKLFLINGCCLLWYLYRNKSVFTNSLYFEIVSDQQP